MARMNKRFEIHGKTVRRPTFLVTASDREVQVMYETVIDRIEADNMDQVETLLQIRKEMHRRGLSRDFNCIPVKS